MYKPKPISSHLEQFEKLIPLTSGPIAEFGVFTGGSTVQLSKFGRPVYAFDTFEGMPFNTPYDPKNDFNNPPGKFKPSVSVIDSLNDYPNIICVKGNFQETLPLFDSSIKFGFVYLDCDWYSSYIFVVKNLVRRVSFNAIALVDDYFYCLGCKKAIDELDGHIVDFDKSCNVLTWRKKLMI